jgi:hypothetical protein
MCLYTFSDLPPPSSAVGHERVELYLYSPYVPYGLYRAPVPVQGCTLHLPFNLYTFCTTRSARPLRVLAADRRPITTDTSQPSTDCKSGDL